MEPFVRRSHLVVSVGDEAQVTTSWTHEADAVILDLTDTVPDADKPQARERIKPALAIAARRGAEAFVHLNKALAYADIAEYRKNKATFDVVPPARVRPPPVPLRPRVPTPGGGPPAPRCPPGAGLARAGAEAPPHPVAPAPPPEVSPRLPARSGGRLAQPALAARRRRLALRRLGDGQAAPLGLRGGLIQTR